ncbi:unnamed protein product [Brassicogethes aeneus]|uniref:RING-type E3 ubiquitin transferase n=1 Tax=Brassicogethes aeneus TaxID=1431903 RepID=A0A9P0ATX5_BRAAE|nr:unnamed protein product [Brassicogethes aeneus]
MAEQTKEQFTDDLLSEKIFHCNICDELCTFDIFLVKGEGNVCGKCFEEKCDEEMKSRAELNAALILIIAKLMLPCKFQAKGCDNRVGSKKYSKHVATCDFKIKPCPMKNLEGCDWSGSSFEVAGHFSENHRDEVVYSDNNIFNVETTLCESVNVKLLTSDHQKCLLKTSVVDDKFYYALNPLEECEENMDYSVKHKSVKTTNHSVLKTVGTITKLNGIYNEENLNANPNATAVDIDSIKHLADEKNVIANEFNLNPKGINESMLKLLECPVCMTIMRPDVYNCTRGHSICSLCRNDLVKCPICKEEITFARNYFIENLTEGIKFPCIYNKHGCKNFGVCNEITNHEIVCPLQQYHCPLCGNFTGSIEFILDHLRSNHKEMECVEKTEIITTKTTNYTDKWIWFDSNLFIISFDDNSPRIYIEIITTNINDTLYRGVIGYKQLFDVNDWFAMEDYKGGHVFFLSIEKYVK